MCHIGNQMEIPYLEYFGFTEKPFGMSPDPEFYFESAEHKKAFDYLTFFNAQQEGFALIYGDVGSGKTTLSRIFLNSLDRNVYNTALILNPVTDETEFMQELLKEFYALYVPDQKKDLYDALRLFLLEEFRKGKENVLIIDEAQLLSYEMLEFIRLLSNIETDKQKILHTVFFAQPEFLTKLKDPRLRHLAQRITVTYGIEPLTYNEIKSYINYRLFKAGSKGPLEFQDRAVRLIPHRIKRVSAPDQLYLRPAVCLCSTLSPTLTVDGHIVSKVLLEESIPLGSVKKTDEGRSLRPLPLISLIVLILILLGLIGYYFFSPVIYSRFIAKKEVPHVPVRTIPQKNRGPDKSRSACETGRATSCTCTGQNPDTATPVAKKIEILLKKVVVEKRRSQRKKGAQHKFCKNRYHYERGSAQGHSRKKRRSNLKWYKVILYEGREGWIADTVVSTARNGR